MTRHRVFSIKCFFFLFLVGFSFNTAISQTEQRFRRLYVLTGIGFPEFLNVNMGYYLNKKISLDADYGIVIFNPMIGVGATYYLYCKNNTNLRHCGLFAVKVRTNPNNNPLKIKSGGETIGSTIELYTGYNFRGNKGFMFRTQLGSLSTIENNHIGLGFNIRIGIGYCL